MAYGYANNTRIPIKKKASGGFFRTETLTPTDWSIIKSIAIDEESEQILSKPEEVYRIAEEYAHGGLKSLIEELNSIQFGSVDKWLEKHTNELFEDIGGSK